VPRAPLSAPPSTASRPARSRRIELLPTAVARVENGDPLASAVVADAHLVAVPRHARHDLADAAPVVEAPM